MPRLPAATQLAWILTISGVVRLGSIAQGLPVTKRGRKAANGSSPLRQERSLPVNFRWHRFAPTVAAFKGT